MQAVEADKAARRTQSVAYNNGQDVGDHDSVLTADEIAYENSRTPIGDEARQAIYEQMPFSVTEPQLVVPDAPDPMSFVPKFEIGPEYSSDVMAMAKMMASRQPSQPWGRSLPLLAARDVTAGGDGAPIVFFSFGSWNDVADAFHAQVTDPWGQMLNESIYGPREPLEFLPSSELPNRTVLIPPVDDSRSRDRGAIGGGYQTARDPERGWLEIYPDNPDAGRGWSTGGGYTPIDMDDIIYGTPIGEPTGPIMMLNKPRDELGRFVPDPANPKSPYEFTDAERRAAWRQLALDPNSPLTPEQRVEVQDRGWRGPQRLNQYGETETMELSHEPVPLRDAGKDVVPRWPDEHAAVDPHRQLKKR